MTYADAQLNCRNKLGSSWLLFEPRDANTNELVLTAAITLIKVINDNWRDHYFWLGINDLANQGQYVYASDGQPVVDGMWTAGQPNDNGHRCVGGYWNSLWWDEGCTYPIYSICQPQNTGKEGTLKHLLVNSFLYHITDYGHPMKAKIKDI